MIFLSQLFPLSLSDGCATGPVKGSRPLPEKNAGLYNYVAFVLNLPSFFSSVFKTKHLHLSCKIYLHYTVKKNYQLFLILPQIPSVLLINKPSLYALA